MDPESKPSEEKSCCRQGRCCCKMAAALVLALLLLLVGAAVGFVMGRHCAPGVCPLPGMKAPAQSQTK